ncbi:type II toxin-antitoxin system HicA family toxin [Hymenobacter aerophilus]|uniref:type II toxin-antitoxin system HicA family toxin n=1 Tax=Hymenobacter aerophilus TaxID=119644 RepID=UPI00036C60EA|nr:type II toxin-antitoxin system HicA family toxin [Hymenobacter aerophilus]
MKVRELKRLIEEDGWRVVRQSGSHQQYKHPTKTGLVTLSGHKPSDEVPPGALNSVLKQAGLK